MWEWLIDQNVFSPLNNVESIYFPDSQDRCDADSTEWNDLKGSWNLALQTLGWGNFLVKRNNETPIFWETITSDEFLANGYSLVTQKCTYFPIIQNSSK